MADLFSQKVKHLIWFGEVIDGKWCYFFGSHLRFRYLLYSILYQKCVLSQGNFYNEHHPKKKLLSIKEMQEMLEAGSYKHAVSKLMHVAKIVKAAVLMRIMSKNNYNSNSIWTFHYIPVIIVCRISLAGVPFPYQSK